MTSGHSTFAVDHIQLTRRGRPVFSQEGMNGIGRFEYDFCTKAHQQVSSVLYLVKNQRSLAHS